MKARSNSEKGMALIITLMMLAIVTFMAVIFLSLSRRERNAVKVSEEQNMSRQMADVGTAKAAAEQIGAMNRAGETFLFPQGIATQPLLNAANNGLYQDLLPRAKFQYNLNVSRPYENSLGFVTAQGTNLANVSYSVSDGKNPATYTPLSRTSTDFKQNVANLLYDPRPPVYVTDPITGVTEFRSYVDMNRNRMFDGTGIDQITGPNGEKYNVNGTIYTGSGRGAETKFIGDPQWVGVLERPDLPHSETNRFIGRYAYLVLPAGKSLDINFIHNRASGAEDSLRTNPNGTNRFSRNQGVGFWELNLAGFFVDFHSTPSTWVKAPFIYDYDFASPNNLGTGRAFQGAQSLLSYRLKETRANLHLPNELFSDGNYVPGAAGRFWSTDYVDESGGGPYVQYNNWYTDTAPIRNGTLRDYDFPARAWFGLDRAEKTGEFPDVQKYFSIPRGTDANFSDFYGRFTNAVSSSRLNTYDRYAYSRFVAQMGADSKPAIQGKIHLNYTNEPGTISTNLMAWVMPTNTPPALMAMPTPMPRPGYWVTNAATGAVQLEQNNLTNFFLIAANEMLRRSLVTNVFLERPFAQQTTVWRTNYTIGGPYFNDPRLNTDVTAARFVVNTPVRHDISITNIQIYHAPLTTPNINYTYVTNAEYSSAVHRVLQLAANIFDTMTNVGPQEPYFPSVFRPTFARTATNVYISGFVFDPIASTFPTDFARVEDYFFSNPRPYDGDRLNIWGQPVVIGAKKGWPNFNELSIESYVQVTRKLELKKAVAGGPVTETNQMYLLGARNIMGMEAWNSYLKDFTRPLTMFASIQLDFGVDATLPNQANRSFIYLATNMIFSTNMVIPANSWKARTGRTLTNSLAANANSDFRIPILTNHFTLPTSDYAPARIFPQLHTATNSLFLKTTLSPYFAMPDFKVHMTNRLFYRVVCEDRIVDWVNVANLAKELDVSALASGMDDNPLNGGLTNAAGLTWMTNLYAKGGPVTGATEGVVNQIEISRGNIGVSTADWRNYSSTSGDLDGSIKRLDEWIKNKPDGRDKDETSKQAGFSPTRVFYMRTSLQANDPLVHYTAADLRPDVDPLQKIPAGAVQNKSNLGRRNNLTRPGGGNYTIKDLRIGESDDWQFPIAKLDNPGAPSTYGIPNFHYRFPNIGTLGRVHRGTPWQTVYLKAGAVGLVNTNDFRDPNSWLGWSGSAGTHPIGDWKFVDLFTTALTENAARGLLSVNQTNIAAWSAVLSGVQVITNNVPTPVFDKSPGLIPPKFGDPRTGLDMVIQPSSYQLSNIVAGINRTRSKQPMGVFGYLGEILATQELSIGGHPSVQNQSYGSPFLNIDNTQLAAGLTDDALEAIPQRILSLLKEDEPRFVVYSFGQTLKPAPGSLAKDTTFYGLCLNYQVMGEYATKTVMRVEGELRNPANPLRTVVESFEQLPPFD